MKPVQSLFSLFFPTATLLAARGIAASLLAHHTHSHASTLICFAFFPTVLEEERDCLQSIREVFFLYSLPLYVKFE